MLGTVICLMTALAAGERYIPGCQGTHENPSGDRIEVTTKTIRVNGEPKVFVMGEMHYARVPVADDFYKGLPMRVGLWRLDQGRVTVRVLPWNDSPLIYVQEPFRPDGKGACAILSLRLYQRPY